MICRDTRVVPGRLLPTSALKSFGTLRPDGFHPPEFLYYLSWRYDSPYLRIDSLKNLKGSILPLDLTSGSPLSFPQIPQTCCGGLHISSIVICKARFLFRCRRNGLRRLHSSSPSIAEIACANQKILISTLCPLSVEGPRCLLLLVWSRQDRS